MKKNDYQNLMEHIQPPAGLNDRVLSAARQTAGAQKETTGPKHLAPGKRRPVLRAAVCAACALALVVGSVTLGPIGGGEPGESGAPVTALPSFSFGLTAYAADTGERYEANANGGLAFSTAGQVSWSAEGGHYTGCLFQVTGENIRTISLAIDREALYRSRTLTNLSREEVQNYLDAEANGTEYRLSSGEGVIHAVYGEEEEGPLTMEVVTDSGAAVTEGYDPEVRYGFLIPDTGDIDWDRDPRVANQESIDRMDGARLTVTVTFTDGSEQTKTYTLSTGRLKVEYDANSPGGFSCPSWPVMKTRGSTASMRWMRRPAVSSSGRCREPTPSASPTPMVPPGGSRAARPVKLTPESTLPRRRARQSWPQRAALWWSPAMTWSEAIMW